MAVAAVDGFGFKFGCGPDLGGVADGFVVAVYTGVKLTAAFVLDGDDVSFGMVMGALSALVYIVAVDGDGLRGGHSLRIEPPDLEYALDFGKAVNELV